MAFTLELGDLLDEEGLVEGWPDFGAEGDEPGDGFDDGDFFYPDPFFWLLAWMETLGLTVPIELEKDETLMMGPEVTSDVTPFLLPLLSVNELRMLAVPFPAGEDGAVDLSGEVGIRVDTSPTEPGRHAKAAHLTLENSVGFVLGTMTDGVEALSLDLNEAIVVLPQDGAYNLLTYDTPPHGAYGAKSLNIHATGLRNIVDLGNENDVDFGIGYYLDNVEITGGGDLILLNLYFNGEGTTFDATKNGGNVTLQGYVYNGFEVDAEYDWNIQFGPGDDVLLIEADGAHNYPGKFGSFIDGGGGWNILDLDAAVYAGWADPEADAVPEGFKFEDRPIVQNFQVLVTESVPGREYKSALLGNTFDEVVVESVGSDGPYTITMAGDFRLDAADLKGDQVTVEVAGEIDNAATLVVADLDSDAGDKFDLPGGLKSEMTIVLPALTHLDEVEFTIENMTIFHTDPELGSVRNDVIDFSAWGMDVVEFLEGIASVFVSEGAAVKGDENAHYRNFEIDFDFAGGDFTLMLKNVVSQLEYEDLLQAAELSAESESLIGLVGVLVEGETFLLEA